MLQKLRGYKVKKFYAYAWAIDTNSKEGHGYIGMYWWFNRQHPIIPEHLKGVRISLFKTRQTARDCLHVTRGAFPKSKVVKVKVTVETVEK